MTSGDRAAPTEERSTASDEAVARATARAEAAVRVLEDARDRVLQHLRDMLPLYEEYQTAVERKKQATREYLRLTGDEGPFGGYFDYREKLLSYQDLKADPALSKMLKALQWCRACKVP